MAPAVMASASVNAGSLLREPLAALGFKKRAGLVFTAELADGVLGWLGLNTATSQIPGTVQINPVVGVRHQGVERVLAELRGEDFHTYVPPTISTPIGYIMPQHQYTAWVIGEGLSTEAAELVAAVAHHGLLFMRSHLELQAILTGIRQRLGYDHQLVYRLPVVLALLGDHDAAKEALGRSLAELGGRQDGAAVDLREFAEAFGRWEARVS